MTVPAYTNDLTTIVDFDGTPGSPSVSEPAAPWADGRQPAVDTDYPIQGTSHCSLVMNTTGKAGAVCSNAGSFSWTSGHYLFGWIIWLAPGAIAERASGGLVIICGSSTSVYKVFYVGGKSFGLYPYGGWQNFAVDPTMTPSEVYGSPTAFYIVGGGANVLSQVSKGSPFGFDAFRYGRGTFRIAGGSSGDGYATFTGMATANDAVSARWGLFQSVQGTYKYKGLMYFGYGAPTEFVDSNKSITIDEMIFVQSDFNRIEFHNASSVIDWTNISFNSIATISPGQLEVVDNCALTFDSCTFQNMDTFIFQSSSNVLNTNFVKCKLITSGGGIFTGTKVLQSAVATDASAFGWNVAVDTDGYLDDMVFTKGTAAHHAINLGASAPVEITLRGLDFSGFSASNEQNDSVLYISRTDSPITINAIGCTGTVSYKRAGSNTVTVAVNPITLRVKVQDRNTSPVPIAQVGIYKISDRTELMNENTRDIDITALVEGTKYIITAVGTGNWTSIGAVTGTLGEVFTKNSTPGTGTGTASDGVAEQAYSGSATDIEVRVRKASSGATKYKNFSTLGTTGANDFELLVTLTEDPINNATS